MASEEVIGKRFSNQAKTVRTSKCDSGRHQRPLYASVDLHKHKGRRQHRCFVEMRQYFIPVF
jgi:hypothetical protein